MSATSSAPGATGSCARWASTASASTPPATSAFPFSSSGWTGCAAHAGPAAVRRGRVLHRQRRDPALVHRADRAAAVAVRLPAALQHARPRVAAKAASTCGEIFDGTLVAQDPELAVTFVDNHDTCQEGRRDEAVADWFLPHAYALILLREGGYPCVFYPDYYGGGGRDQSAAAARRAAGGAARQRLRPADRLLRRRQRHRLDQGGRRRASARPGGGDDRRRRRGRSG